MTVQKKVKQKKIKKVVTVCVIKIYTTFNNLIVTATDRAGNVISQASCGSLGAVGQKKSSAYFSDKTIDKVIQTMISLYGSKVLEVQFKGPGIYARDATVRYLAKIADSVVVSYIQDSTPVAHNGCRSRKKPKK